MRKLEPAIEDLAEQVIANGGASCAGAGTPAGARRSGKRPTRRNRRSAAMSHEIRTPFTAFRYGYPLADKPLAANYRDDLQAIIDRAKSLPAILTIFLITGDWKRGGTNVSLARAV